MIEAELVDGKGWPFVPCRDAFQCYTAIVRRRQFAGRDEARRRDHQCGDGVALWNVWGIGTKIAGLAAIRDRAQPLLHALGLAHRMAECDSILELLEGHEQVAPVYGRLHRQRQSDEQPGRPEGAVDEIALAAGQINQSRDFLDGDEARADQVAGFAQAAPRDRADASCPPDTKPPTVAVSQVEGNMRSS